MPPNPPGFGPPKRPEFKPRGTPHLTTGLRDAYDAQKRMQRIAMSSIVLLLCLSSAARADVKITVTYTVVEHEVSPENAIHKAALKRELILTSDHKINSVLDLAGHQLSTHTSLFGKTYRNDSTGMPYYNGRWSIKNGSIVFLASSESYLWTIRISTNGIDACRATIQFWLKNGHKLFEDKTMSNHEDVTMDDLHAENIACTIADVNH